MIGAAALGAGGRYTLIALLFAIVALAYTTKSKVNPLAIARKLQAQHYRQRALSHRAKPYAAFFPWGGPRAAPHRASSRKGKLAPLLHPSPRLRRAPVKLAQRL